MNKNNSNSSKRCVLEADLVYLKELRELHNDYPLAPDKIEFEREMLSEYQLKIGLHNTLNGNIKKFMPNFFEKVFYYENLQLYLKLGLKLKKIQRVLEFNQSHWLKPNIESNTENRIEAEKNNGKDGKALYKLMNNTTYEKAMENLINRINVKLVNNKKILFKMYIKTKLHVVQII